MAGSYCYDYPRPAVTVDIAVFRAHAEQLQVLLIQRRKPPFEGRWALVGGFIDPDEDLRAAARRELEEETGIKGVRPRQVHAFGAPGRDPRGHTVSIAHLAVIAPDQAAPRAGDDAAALDWFDAAQPPPLAFDHDRVLQVARSALRRWVRHTPLILDLLPEPFGPAEVAATLRAVGLAARWAPVLLRRLERRGKVRASTPGAVYQRERGQ